MFWLQYRIILGIKCNCTDTNIVTRAVYYDKDNDIGLSNVMLLLIEICACTYGKLNVVWTD